jgi:Calx-beta domain
MWPLPTGTLTFNEGEVTKTITVAVLDDGVTGVNSTLAMSISNPSVGVLLNQTQNSIIQDGTRSMQWSVNGSGYNIEDAGSAMFTVVRSGDLSTQQTIRFYTENFQATSGLDYTAVDTILTFEAGESVKSVSVSILTDSISETQAEHFLVKIASPSSGVVTSSSAYGPIIDADQAIWQVERFASEVSEGGGGMAFLISRVGATPAASLQYSVVDSNNSNAVITAATTLSFSEGETSKVVYLPLVDNSTVPPVNPKYTVSLSAMTHGIINDNSWATAPSSNWNTIVKDNDQVFLNVYGANSQTQDFRNILPESVAGSPNVAIFRIVRTGNTDVSTTVDFAINSTAPSTQQYTYADGTPYLYGRAMVATGGVDYVALTTNQVSFSAGETVKEIVVQLINDNVAEVHKFINMVISNGSSSNSMTTTLQKTNVNNFIIDDDTPSSGITDDNDTVTNFGGTGVNVINLGAGQDILRLNASQAGGGLFQGGASWATGDYSDELDASAITGSITWQLGAPVAHGGFDGTMTYSGGGIDTFWNFEIFKLGSGANTLTSTGGNASQVHAYAHHQVTLGAGGDTLYIQRDLAGVGGGTFNGGGGTDTLSFANATEGVSVGGQYFCGNVWHGRLEWCIQQF